jgi:hypothetical protein
MMMKVPLIIGVLCMVGQQGPMSQIRACNSVECESTLDDGELEAIQPLLFILQRTRRSSEARS